MNLTKKDNLLLTLLLPLLIAAAYVFLWSRPTLKETARLEACLRALGDEASLLERRDKLSAEQRHLQKALADAQGRAAAQAAPQQALVAEDAAASLRRLQDTFHRNGVRLVSATAGAPHDEATRADRGVADLMRLNGTPHPKMWDVTVEASYDALLRLLDACSACRSPIVPLSLSMRPGLGDNKATYWTLNVCL